MPDGWEWLVLGAVIYADLGLGTGLFLWSGLPPACVCADGPLGTNTTPDCPNHRGARAGGMHAGRCMCFMGMGPPSRGGHCCREDKAGCLARGKEEKSQREEALMQDITLP